jgi:HlyD family secretion protein
MDRPIRRSFAQRWWKHGAAGAVLIALLGTAAWLAPAGTRSLKVANDRIAVSEVAPGRFDDFIPVRGRVTPLRTIYLDAVDGGRVERVLVEDGAMVEAGQLLVELSNTALQLDAISREAQVTEQMNNLRTLELDLARNTLQHERDLVDIDYELTRLQRLVERRRSQAERGNIPRADWEDAEDELEYYRRKRAVTLESQKTDMRLQQAQLQQLRDSGRQLEANLEIARRNLASLQVRAPMPGKLTALNAEVGQSLQAGERLGQIDDPEGFKLSAHIDEFYLGRVDLEQTADLIDAGRAHALRVSKIYPQVTDGRFEIELTFTGEPPAGIRRGQTLQLQLVLGDPVDALLIPNGAFYQDTGGDWLFVVSADGTQAVRRDVRLGRRNQRFIEVLDGLEPGERVVTSPYTSYLDMHRLVLSP